MIKKKNNIACYNFVDDYICIRISFSVQVVVQIIQDIQQIHPVISPLQHLTSAAHTLATTSRHQTAPQPHHMD